MTTYIYIMYVYIYMCICDYMYTYTIKFTQFSPTLPPTSLATGCSALFFSPSDQCSQDAIQLPHELSSAKPGAWKRGSWL